MGTWGPIPLKTPPNTLNYGSNMSIPLVYIYRTLTGKHCLHKMNRLTTEDEFNKRGRAILQVLFFSSGNV